jgi:hypothetical protein
MSFHARGECVQRSDSRRMWMNDVPDELEELQEMSIIQGHCILKRRNSDGKLVSVHCWIGDQDAPIWNLPVIKSEPESRTESDGDQTPTSTPGQTGLPSTEGSSPLMLMSQRQSWLTDEAVRLKIPGCLCSRSQS